MPTIGVLALQGAFIEHVRKLERLGVEVREVRVPADLDGIDGLIIPGGESTTIGKLIDWYGLREPIVDLAADTPIWGTCAGMILLAHEVDADSRGEQQPLLDMMDISVRRNAFGSQLDSFEADLDVPELSDEPIHAVFIRAPIVTETGAQVDVLARLDDGRVVAVRQGNLLATSFHPELTDDETFHRWFVDLVQASQREREPEMANAS